MIPYEIYLRYAHKLDLVAEGQAIPVTTTDIKAADVAGVETPARPIALPTWPMRIGPEEYLGLYEDRPDPSKTMLERLALARRIVAAKEAHG